MASNIFDFSRFFGPGATTTVEKYKKLNETEDFAKLKTSAEESLSSTVAAAKAKAASTVRSGTNVASDFKPIQEKIEATKKNTSKIEIFSFPRERAPYQIMFIFSKFERDDISTLNIADPTKIKQQNLSNPNCAIVLPIPANLNDVTAIQFDEAATGVFGGEIVENTVQFARDIANAKSLDDVKNTGLGALNDLNSLINSKSAAALATAVIRRGLSGTSPGNIIDQTLGDIPNPNLGLFFKGVPLRSFEYTWRLSPNTIEESYELRSIIMKLKEKSLPSRKNGYFLNYPDLVEVKFVQNEDMLYKHKICFIEAVNVNYSPNGTPAFFAGTDAPIEVDLTIKLRETAIFTREDFISSETK